MINYFKIQPLHAMFYNIVFLEIMSLGKKFYDLIVLFIHLAIKPYLLKCFRNVVCSVFFER